MFYVYVLQSLSSGKFYVGSTRDLERRLVDHNRGKVRWTRKKGPWKMVYSEELLTRSEAMRRERQIKSFKGGEAFKKLIRSE